MRSSLPFVDPNFHIQGVLRLEDEELVLEWRRVHPIFFHPLLMGLPSKKYPPQQVHIPLSQLEEVEYRNPFYLFHATLRIRVRDLQTLAPVPGSDGAEVTLYCKKRYRHIAQEIANSVTFQRLEQVFP